MIEPKYILLTQGKSAIVDEDDYERVNKLSWFAVRDETRWYARSHEDKSMKYKVLPLHRFILNAPKGTYVDHINGDGLDNRKKNLRLCTNAQNCANRGASCNAEIPFKGVFMSPAGNYRVTYTLNRKKTVIGTFRNPELAGKIFDVITKPIWGEFARPNFDLTPSEESELLEYYDYYKSRVGTLYNKKSKKWRAKIPGHKSCLGSYLTEWEAIRAIQKAI